MATYNPERSYILGGTHPVVSDINIERRYGGRLIYGDMGQPPLGNDDGDEPALLVPPKNYGSGGAVAELIKIS